MKKSMGAKCLIYIILTLFLLAGCEGGEVSPTEPSTQPKATYTVSFTLLDYLHFSQEVEEGSCANTFALPAGLTIAGWTDADGNPADPFTVAVTKDTAYTGIAYPALTNHVPYLFADADGLIQPQLPLTGDALQQALTALAAEGAEEYFPGMPTGAKPVSAKQLNATLRHFFPAEEVDAFFPADSAEDVSRNAFAVGMHTLLKRDAKELLQLTDGAIVPGDIILDSDDAICLLEASVAHTSADTGSSWLEMDLPSAFEPGFVNIHGYLYYVQEDGAFLKNGESGGLQFGADGRYTSGDEDLDTMVAEILDKIIAGNPEADRLEQLRSAFVYCRDSFTYRRREAYAFGQTGWEASDAKTMFETSKGNCYNFAAAFWALARGLGYDAQAVSGTVLQDDQPHGWVFIDIDEQTYIFDPEWEYVYRYERDDLTKDMFMLTLTDGLWWNYKW